MAAGCSGGDWDRVSETWDLHRYRAMTDHWRQWGPPAYMSLAVQIGWKPEGGARSAEGEPQVHSPEELADLVRQFGSGG